jgi:hypothetical protein
LSTDVRPLRKIAAILSGMLVQPFHAAIHRLEQFYQALLAGGMEPIYAGCARETLIVGVAPMEWPASALAHQAQFTDQQD